MLALNGLEFLSRFDVLVLTETFQTTDSNIPFRCFETLACQPERGRPMGGILVATTPELMPQLVFKSNNCVAISSSLGNMVGCYFSPDLNIDNIIDEMLNVCLLYTSPSPRDKRQSRMPSSA